MSLTLQFPIAGAQWLLENNYLRFVLLVILLFTCSTKSNAQLIEFSYTNFTKDDGLPSNIVYSIEEDKNNMIWLGTDEGIFKLNYNASKLFNLKDGLPHNDVFSLYCDKNNKIWINTIGKHLYYIENDKLKKFDSKSKASNLIIENRISETFEDSNGDLTLISFPFIINKLNKDIPSVIICGRENNCIENNCFKVRKTKFGILYVCSKQSYFYSYKENRYTKLDQKENINDIFFDDSNCYVLTEKYQIVKHQYNEKSLAELGYVSNIQKKMLYLSEDYIWQIKQKGIVRINKENLNNRIEILDNIIVSDIKMINQKLWVSTLGNGIYRINSQNVKNIKLNQTQQKEIILSVAKYNNELYLGTNFGRIYIVDILKTRLIKIIEISKSNPTIPRILKLCVANESILVATDAGAYELFIRSKYVSKIETTSLAIKNIFFHNSTRIILSNRDVILLGNKTKLYPKSNQTRFYGFAEHKNKYYFGAEDGLYVLKGNALKKINIYNENEVEIKSLHSIDSILIIITSNSGILGILPNNEIQHISKVINDYKINSIVPFNQRLYLATDRGVLITSRKFIIEKTISENEGLSNNNVQDLIVDNNKLIATTENGISIVDLENTECVLKPEIRIENLTTSSIEANYNDTIELHSEDELKISINISKISTKNGYRFFYKSDTKLTDYSETYDQILKLKYKNVGTYILEVYAADNFNSKSESEYLTIIIKPYFYETISAKISIGIIVLVVFAALVFMIVKHFINLEKKKNKLNERLLKLELDSWKALINPHFMFNALNTIQSLFIKESFEKANSLLSKFSYLLRKTIDNSDTLVHTLKDEIEYITNYLEVENQMRSNSFDYSVEVDKNINLTMSIPTLLLQPLVENSIKHNSNQNDRLFVSITISVANNVLLIKIDDNGKIKSESNLKGKGIKLINEKIQLLNRFHNLQIKFSQTVETNNVRISRLSSLIEIYPYYVQSKSTNN